jgi:hypothetical protein
MNWIDFFSEGEDSEAVLNYFSYILQQMLNLRSVGMISMEKRRESRLISILESDFLPIEDEINQKFSEIFSEKTLSKVKLEELANLINELISKYKDLI